MRLTRYGVGVTAEEKIALVAQYGFNTNEAQAWYARYCQKGRTAAQANLKLGLSFSDYLKKAKEAKLTSPSQIGIRRGQYVLGRIGDLGDYTVDNCRIIPVEQNFRELVENGGRARGEAKRASKGTLVDPYGEVHRIQNFSAFGKKHDLSQTIISNIVLKKLPYHRGWTDGSDVDEGDHPYVVYTSSTFHTSSVGSYTSIVFRDGKEISCFSETVYDPKPGQLEQFSFYKTLAHFEEKSNLIIFSPHKHAVKCLTVWAAQWKTLGWKTTQGEPIHNEELIRKAYDLALFHNTKLFWVNGHWKKHKPRNVP